MTEGWTRVTVFRVLATVAFAAVVSVCVSFASATAAFADACPAGGEHTYSWSVVTPASEDADGLREGVCTKCGEVIDIAIPATGHLWSDWVVDVEPNCTDEGSEHRTCTRFPDNPHTEYRIIPPLSATGDHTWVERDRTDATCTETGHVDYVCSVCGATRGEDIAPMGHDWGEWVTIREASPDEQGLQRRECRNDATHTEERPIVWTEAEPVDEPEAPTPDVAPTDPVEPEPEPEPAEETTLFSREFLSAGPTSFDRTVAAVDGGMIIIAAVIMTPLLLRFRWVRIHTRRARETYFENRTAQADGKGESES